MTTQTSPEVINYTYNSNILFEPEGTEGIDVQATIAAFEADVRRVLQRDYPDAQIEIHDAECYRTIVHTTPDMDATRAGFDSLGIEIEIDLQNELHDWDGYVSSD